MSIYLEDIDKLNQIRKGLSGVDSKVLFNIGTMGPLTTAAISAYQRELRLMGETQYVENAFKRLNELTRETKENVAELINAELEEIALTNSTTHGIHTVLLSFDWQRGDEVITTDKEHFAVILPLLYLKERYEINIKYYDTDNPNLADLNKKITVKTKLVVLSHVSYFTGKVLPIKEIVQLAHNKKVPVLADGAQAVGAIPVDIKDLEVDYYSFPSQKWLNGPQGAGALYVNKKIVEDYQPTEFANPFPYKALKLHSGIKRYETVLPNSLAIAGFGESIKWLIQDVKREYAFERIQVLGKYLRKELSDLTGVTVVTPENAAGLTSIYTDFIDAKLLQQELLKKGIITRTVDPLGFLRISLSYFHTKEEADKLVCQIKQII